MEISYQGKKIEVDNMEPVTLSENWNSYRLSDGKVLRIKTVVINIMRSNEIKDQDGNSTYIVKSNNIIDVIKK